MKSSIIGMFEWQRRRHGIRCPIIISGTFFECYPYQTKLTIALFSLLASLHELNAVLEENVPVFVTEPISLICHLSCVMLDCKPSREAYIVLSTRQLNFVQFLQEQTG